MLKAEYCCDFCRDHVVPDVGKSVLEFGLGQEIFLFSYKSRPIHPSISCVLWILFPAVTRLKREPDHSPTFNAK
jgi:hypothetical protein